MAPIVVGSASFFCFSFGLLSLAGELVSFGLYEADILLHSPQLVAGGFAFVFFLGGCGLPSCLVLEPGASLLECLALELLHPLGEGLFLRFRSSGSDGGQAASKFFLQALFEFCDHVIQGVNVRIWGRGAGSGMTFRPCVRKALSLKASEPMPPARCRSWMFGTPCAAQLCPPDRAAEP